MISLGKYELNFLRSIEHSLSLVPSNLDSVSKDLWRSTLLSLKNHLKHIALLINYHYESN